MKSQDNFPYLMLFVSTGVLLMFLAMLSWRIEAIEGGMTRKDIVAIQFDQIEYHLKYIERDLREIRQRQ